MRLVESLLLEDVEEEDEAERSSRGVPSQRNHYSLEVFRPKLDDQLTAPRRPSQRHLRSSGSAGSRGRKAAERLPLTRLSTSHNHAEAG